MAERICSIEGCERPQLAKGMCSTHLHRVQRYGDPNFIKRPRRASGPCALEGCEAKPYAKGLCSKHYQRAVRHGDPEALLYADGERHGHWSGDEVTYRGAHARVALARGQASSHYCVDCGGSANDWSLRAGRGRLISPRGWAYSPDPEDYEPRCKPCHKAYDKPATDPPDGLRA
jgi:hypothetical protein